MLFAPFRKQAAPYQPEGAITGRHIFSDGDIKFLAALKIKPDADASAPPTATPGTATAFVKTLEENYER